MGDEIGQGEGGAKYTWAIGCADECTVLWGLCGGALVSPATDSIVSSPQLTFTVNLIMKRTPYVHVWLSDP